MKVRGLLACVAVAFAFSAAGDTSLAAAAPTKPDSDAPPGASPGWLPNETWVMERWLPFDEPALEAALGGTPMQVVDTYLKRGLSIADLAHDRGANAARLPEMLVDARGQSFSKKQRAVLVRRAQRVLTQSHLAEHVLGHAFHLLSLYRVRASMLGVTEAQYTQLYWAEGRSVAEVAAVGHVARATVRARAMRLANAAGARGVRVAAMSPEENRLMRERDRAGFDSWFSWKHAAARSASTPGLSRQVLCNLHQRRTP